MKLENLTNIPVLGPDINASNSRSKILISSYKLVIKFSLL